MQGGEILLGKWDVYDKDVTLTGYTKTKNDVWCNIGGAVISGESSRQGCALEVEGGVK